MLAGDAIPVRFGLKTDQADLSKNVADGDSDLTHWTSQSTYYEGKVIITSLTANANNGENATYSVTLTGTGSIKKAGTSND